MDRGGRSLPRSTRRSMPSTPDRTRQQRVLTVALEVFGRYGFRKTSMNEVARSADISRQGLYLHFGKQGSVVPGRGPQGTRHRARRCFCLDEEGAALSQRVVAALDAWLGRYVGSMLAADISACCGTPPGRSWAWSPRPSPVRCPAGEGDRRGDSQARPPPVGRDPRGIAAALHLVGQGARYLSTFGRESRAEFIVRLTLAVRLILAGLDATPSA